MIGYNSRLDEIQAAVLLIKLQYLDKWNQKRTELALEYNHRLSSPEITTPFTSPYAEHVYHLYTIRVKQRDELQQHLKAQGIATGIYYPTPLHLIDAYSSLGYKEDDFPQAEQAAKETLTIPLYPEMSNEQVAFVTSSILNFYTM